MDISREFVEKPRYVEVEKFVESRTNSIAQLLKAIDNAALVSGEVTKGPRTAAQRLPRHMRRRAMAYEVRRFPKGMRDFAAAHILSNHRKKPPSRFARRKPTKCLEPIYRNRMKNGAWMETHIWHAKRFRMVKRWGFKIADRSYQRGFRSVIRDSNKHCAIRDRSFLACFLVSGVEIEHVLKRLTPISNSRKNMKFETSIQFYEPNKYPNGYIGPGRIQWVEEQKVAIWVHPTNKDQIMKLLLEIVEIDRDSGVKDENTGIEYFEKKVSTKIWVFHNVLNRFRLYGPMAVEKFGGAVRLADGEEFRPHHEQWRKIMASKNSCTIPDGLVISLSIEDPRVGWSRKKAEKNESRGNLDLNVIDWEQPSTSFWSPEVRETALKNRVSNADFQNQEAESIGGVVQTAAKIPILVVFRNSSQSVLDGLEIIVPQNFGKDLWIALQRQNVRASGLRDDTAAHLEARRFCFPNDDVDSEAGKEFERWMKEELESRNNARPQNRRCKFWDALSIKYPFDYHFDELVENWRPENSMETDSNRAVICRNPVELLEFSNLLKGGDSHATFDENMLIPVRLDFLGRGRPKKFGIICVPSDRDLISLRENRNREIIQEPRVEKLVEGEEKEENSENQTRRLQGFVALNAAAREKPISLKGLFELSSKLDDKSEKKRKANKKKKEKTKRRKIEQASREEVEKTSEDEKSTVEYRYSANREIIGRIMSGEQSYLGGHGIAMGYICAATIRKIAANYGKTQSIVLVRNSTSKYYHPAHVSVVRQQIEI